MNKKYCLHPGKLKVKIAGRKENGEPSGKFDWGMQYFSALELAAKYRVSLDDCVTWGKGIKADELIHLFPDPKGLYELPDVGAPKRSASKSKVPR